MTSYRRSAMQKCPRCGHTDDPEGFFHSGDGLVCEPCHRSEKRADRARHLQSEGSVDAMLNALLAPTCGIGCVLFAFLSDGPLPVRALVLFAFGLSAVGACIVRAFRFPTDIRHVRQWRFVASAGGVLALIALATFAARA